MRILVNLVSFFIPNLIVYLAVSYLTLELNPLNWSLIYRILFILGLGVVNYLLISRLIKNRINEFRVPEIKIDKSVSTDKPINSYEHPFTEEDYNRLQSAVSKI